MRLEKAVKGLCCWNPQLRHVNPMNLIFLEGGALI